MKTQPMKIFANDMTNKGLISKICKYPIQLKKKKKKNWSKHGRKKWINIFQRGHTDSQQEHEKMLNVANY